MLQYYAQLLRLTAVGGVVSFSCYYCATLTETHLRYIELQDVVTSIILSEVYKVFSSTEILLMACLKVRYTLTTERWVVYFVWQPLAE